MSEVSPSRAGARFDRVAIAGLGLIGASIAMAIRRARAASAIAGIDNSEVLRKALERGVIDAGSERLEIIEGADLVILAAPVGRNIELLGRLRPHVTPATIVTDVGSTKRTTVAAASALAGSLTFVGGHPVAGAASGGIDSASADLFIGRRWVLTPDRDTPPEQLARLLAFIRTLGAEPHLMDAAEHDRVLAFTSHLPQLAASALMRVVGEGAGEAGLALAGPGLADTTRLAGSPFGIWRDIWLTNEDNIRAALNALIGTLDRMRMENAAALQLEEVFSEASMWRERAVAAARPGVPNPRPLKGSG
jgi:prephenate dehydrogenase